MIVVSVDGEDYAPFTWEKSARLYNKILNRTEEVEIVVQHHSVKMKAIDNYEAGSLKLTKGSDCSVM